MRANSDFLPSTSGTGRNSRLKLSPCPIVLPTSRSNRLGSNRFKLELCVKRITPTIRYRLSYRKIRI